MLLTFLLNALHIVIFLKVCEKLENHTKVIRSCQYTVNQVPADFLLPFIAWVFVGSYG